MIQAAALLARLSPKLLTWTNSASTGGARGGQFSDCLPVTSAKYIEYKIVRPRNPFFNQTMHFTGIRIQGNKSGCHAENVGKHLHSFARDGDEEKANDERKRKRFSRKSVRKTKRLQGSTNDLLKSIVRMSNVLCHATKNVRQTATCIFLTKMRFPSRNFVDLM